MTAVPVRLQSSRARGFNLQRVSRETNSLPGRRVTRVCALGNPFVVGVDGTREECCLLYAHLLSGRYCLTTKASVDDQRTCLHATMRALPKIKDHNLFCTCRFDGKPCHAGILILRANLSNERYRELGLMEPQALMRAASNPRFLVELANR